MRLKKVRKSLVKEIRSIFKENPGKAWNHKQVAARLDIDPGDQYNRLLVQECLDALEHEAFLKHDGRGKYVYEGVRGTAEGRVAMLQSGNAYVISDASEDDIYIPSRKLRSALHGDTVKVFIAARKRRGKLEGEILEVLERAKSSFVGVLEKNEQFAFLIPDSDKMPQHVFIPPRYMHGANHGDKVLVDIIEWGQEGKNPVGKVAEVLGKPGENETEMHAILAEFGFPLSFPGEVEAEAEAIPDRIDSKEIERRLDLRAVPTFTIDPEDAKDFDDALSIRLLEEGLWEVGVHIADVSHYIEPGSLLDKEAKQRATSVYLVDRVIPMLPEKLSNGLCSLRPHEDKLCFSAVFHMNALAEVKNVWIGRTVIHSDQRFTYEEAQQIIEGKGGPTLKIEAKDLLQLHEMALRLRKDRFKQGALRVEQSEVKFRLDEDGKPLGVYFKESKEANHLIEEFMLLANKKVAECIGQPKGKQASPKNFVYRVHDSPDLEKLKEFKRFISTFGYKIDLSHPRAISKSLNRLLDEVQGKPEQNMIQTLAIRSMAKAVYTTQNVGHYGLAFDYYTHFTSPIRRWPDVMVHRLLAAYLSDAPSQAKDPLEAQCKHSSEMERKAAEAERASTKYKQVEYMKMHLGESFKGVISGVTEWGIFVEIKENKCEGMIRLRDLEQDYFYFDEKQYCVRGSKTGLEYRLGDEVDIVVKRADLERRQLDFNLLV